MAALEPWCPALGLWSLLTENITAADLSLETSCLRTAWLIFDQIKNNKINKHLQLVAFQSARDFFWREHVSRLSHTDADQCSFGQYFQFILNLGRVKSTKGDKIRKWNLSGGIRSPRGFYSLAVGPCVTIKLSALPERMPWCHLEKKETGNKKRVRTHGHDSQARSLHWPVRENSRE